MSTKEAPIYDRPERVAKAGMYYYAAQSGDDLITLMWGIPHTSYESAHADAADYQRRLAEAEYSGFDKVLVFKVVEALPVGKDPLDGGSNEGSLVEPGVVRPVFDFSQKACLNALESKVGTPAFLGAVATSLEKALADIIQVHLEKTERDMTVAKADKCVNHALYLLGCTATDAEVEALADEWMDKPDEELDAAIEASRLATEKKDAAQ